LEDAVNDEEALSVTVTVTNELICEFPMLVPRTVHVVPVEHPLTIESPEPNFHEYA
jgi:hypothetical protein